jgi:N-acylneuraminate cytidylyltransferase
LIKRLAIIPARKKSKRILNKNRYIFCGKPILYYALDLAKKSKLFDTIHVSTNCDKIIKLIKNYGFPHFFKRPNRLSSNNISLADVINYELSEFKKIGKKFDVVTLIYPWSALINCNDLIKANKKFEKNKRLFPVLSVSTYPAPPEWAFEKKNKFIQPLNKKNVKKNSQEFTKKYFDTGDFIFYSTDKINNQIKNLKKLTKFIPYEIEKHRSIDVDDLEDISFFKKLFSIKN